jgi:hypothetical protein
VFLDESEAEIPLVETGGEAEAPPIQSAAASS